ncbi:hypothetical protein M3Y99_00147000 [Aphelenchoides fujianensis]|nr:hypothetical protein M3Y99_00147000 [Aphelenchoides fujianensis]
MFFLLLFVLVATKIVVAHATDQGGILHLAFRAENRRRDLVDSGYVVEFSLGTPQQAAQLALFHPFFHEVVVIDAGCGETADGCPFYCRDDFFRPIYCDLTCTQLTPQNRPAVCLSPFQLNMSACPYESSASSTSTVLDRKWRAERAETRPLVGVYVRDALNFHSHWAFHGFQILWNTPAQMALLPPAIIELYLREGVITRPPGDVYVNLCNQTAGGARFVAADGQKLVLAHEHLFKYSAQSSGRCTSFVDEAEGGASFRSFDWALGSFFASFHCLTFDFERREMGIGVVGGRFMEE